MSAGLSRAEMDQFTPLQLSVQPFNLVVNLWCKLASEERATKNEINASHSKQGGEGAVKLLSLKSHATASLITKCYLYPSFNGERLYSFLNLSFWFWTRIEQLNTTEWAIKSVDLLKTVTVTFSQNGLCWLITPPPSLMRSCTRLYSQSLYWHKRNTARTLIKCYLQLVLLTLQQDKVKCHL